MGLGKQLLLTVLSMPTSKADVQDKTLKKEYKCCHLKIYLTQFTLRVVRKPSRYQSCSSTYIIIILV